MFRKFIGLALSLASIGYVVPANAQPIGTVSASRATMCDPLYAGQKRPDDIAGCTVTPMTWPTGSNAAVVGDGVTTGSGGLPPFIATPPLPGIATASPDNYRTAGPIENMGCDPVWSTATYKCVDGSGNFRGGEFKFRTTVGVTGYAYADPERNYGDPGKSHLHEFFGGCEFGDKQTYAKNRVINSSGDGAGADCSFADGQNLNNTLYWKPAMVTCVGGTPAPVTTVGGVQAVVLTEANLPRNGCVGGKLGAIRRPHITVYYVSGDGPNTVPLANGQRYVVGYNMDDPLSQKKMLDDANAAAGSTRYAAHNGTATVPTDPSEYWKYSAAFSPYTFHRYTCTDDLGTANTGDDISTTTTQLRNPDGTDAFGGHCPATRYDGSANPITMFFTVSINGGGVQCTDGTNLWTPSGYTHVVPPLFDLTNNKAACPQGWYKQVAINLNSGLEHNGFAPRADGTGYGAWELSSDAMAKNPNGGTGVPPGYSMHVDWMDGWDPATKNGWEGFCIGQKVINPNSGTAPGMGPFECNDSAFSAGYKMPNNPLRESTQRVEIVPPKNSGSISTHPGH